MPIPKNSLLFTLATSLLVLAGCTQTTTNTNTVSNANENTNTEVVVNTNDNSNTVDEGGEVETNIDTSDWLTYTNEEHGFSFKYPKEWLIDVIDESDEGGMGLNIGSIVMSSSDCRAQGDLLKAGAIEETKKTYINDVSKALVEIDRNSITGIQYYDVVNENNYKGYIYMYLIRQDEFSFRLVDHPTNQSCQLIFGEIMKTLTLNS